MRWGGMKEGNGNLLNKHENEMRTYVNMEYVKLSVEYYVKLHTILTHSLLT